ncbi:hypothetical protein ACIQ4Z_08920 [Peribacillus asahii]|uniref:hypothetical protein n=1 Tax=Peribacillus asahii TaxID=228899 RepID=UPI003824EACF
MSLNEFIELKERVAIGEEFSFNYKNDEYWISQNPDRYYLTRVKDSFTQEFNTSEVLFENGTIEGRLLSEIYMDIDW